MSKRSPPLSGGWKNLMWLIVLLKKKKKKKPQPNEIVRHTFGIEILRVPLRARRERQLQH